MSEKTEKPTPKKLRDARQQGNLMSSKEVVSTVVMMTGLLTVYALAFDLPSRFEQAIDELIKMVALIDSGTQAQRFALDLGTQLLAVCGVVYGAVILSAVVANVGQFGFYFSFAKFSKGMESLNPVSNAKNLVSKKTLVTFIVNLAKVLIILGISYYLISEEEKTIIQDVYVCQSDLLCGLSVAALYGFKLVMYIVCAMIPISAIDWIVQRSLYMKDLMMSIDEVHREFKESEGSPEMKGQRKQVAHEIVNEDPAPLAQDASVVVRNPTHVAVALRYEPDLVPLPYIICMGTDKLAERIIRHAERHGVPTFEDVPLARGLLDACEVGEHVPAAYIEPMARVIRWLYLNYPQHVYRGEQQKGNTVIQENSGPARSYRDGTVYGNARTHGNREPRRTPMGA
ncbi:MAG: EscU/YscU/HrcU family type III secretion system export apparatus switch protein [Gammaproteobacteria bacterium]